MTELSFCSLCFSFGHQREQCKCNFPSIDFFKSEIEQRSNTIINRYPNFCDSYDEFGPYQVDNTIKKVSTEYNDSIDCFSDQILEKTEKQLYEIFETNLKPNENECLIRYWSIYKITRLIESLVPGSICVPQGSSIIGTFTVDSDVDLIVFNENKNIEEIYEIIEDRPEFENIQLNLRKRISFIACKDKETGINYEILKNSVGGLLSANRVKKMFSEFQNIHLFELSMLVKSFFSGIECHKVYTGGFSSTMIIQICLFFALKTKHMKFSYI
ncbi:hypothetical protein TRFO_20686 [Tritrichomonas foetus]|uniref:Poly(A) RNA polymerase mitochondrial-like central palm domain-containing protein n=1 Tax=Tritrichomonas foetus TaxID=1144522 RepID=A0A1J4KG04_9EUKA|nr:hypothetical protein TRFO_20686 [Tritrichomonas foetus]|eukprot:OHT10139.1 hypothetical protein TRFO_20686 [Tritrichomonas foetus]